MKFKLISIFVLFCWSLSLTFPLNFVLRYTITYMLLSFRWSYKHLKFNIPKLTPLSDPTCPFHFFLSKWKTHPSTNSDFETILDSTFTHILCSIRQPCSFYFQNTFIVFHYFHCFCLIQKGKEQINIWDRRV